MNLKLMPIAIIMICISIKARPQTVRTNSYDQNSIIKDSSGSIIPFKIWSCLMSSGDYIIQQKPIESGDTTARLIKLTYQVQQRMAKNYKPYECPFLHLGQQVQIDTRDINHNYYDTKNLLGKIVVIWFWHISECSSYSLKPMNNLVDTFSNNSEIVFLSICLDDKSSINQFLKEFEAKFNIVPDGIAIADRMGIGSNSAFIILDKSEKIYYQSCGMGTSTIYWMKKAIRELL
jgi:hypothetical protein